jgi:hypothetical protein
MDHASNAAVMRRDRRGTLAASLQRTAHHSQFTATESRIVEPHQDIANMSQHDI